MSAGEPAPAKTTYHPENLTDRAAMLAMRVMIALQPPADVGPAGRTAFDELMSKTPAADGVTYMAAVVGGVHGWWARPPRRRCRRRNPLPPWRRLCRRIGASLSPFCRADRRARQGAGVRRGLWTGAGATLSGGRRGRRRGLSRAGGRRLSKHRYCGRFRRRGTCLGYGDSDDPSRARRRDALSDRRLCDVAVD
jgi:hypothetical protein